MVRPLHVLYGGAHLFSAAAPAKLASVAQSSFATWAGSPEAFAAALGAEDHAAKIHERVSAKLAAGAIEAMCIDFEDGYGPRSDEEEDSDAARTAGELAKVDAGAPRIGIRVKALAQSTRERSLRTLARFFDTFAATGRPLPPGFTVTLPKATSAGHVALLVASLGELERRHGLPRIAIELMIESPRALLDDDGRVPIAGLVAAGDGRIGALHLGAYDLTAELGVAASDQRLDHPFCDHARTVIQLALAGSTVVCVDGATTTLPIAPKGAAASDTTARAAVHRAWGLHARNVTRAIDFGIWQGWDLHPAQLPARWGALAAYFLARQEALAARLRAFIERATQATRVGQVFDDAATGLGLMTFFRRGLAAGVLDDHDLAATTLSRRDLERGSFAELVRARTGDSR